MQKPEIVFETPVSAVVDGHDGMGQIDWSFCYGTGYQESQRNIGLAIVSVRDSNHFGIAGYYAKMACDQGSSVWLLQTQKPSLFRHSARKPCWAQTQLLFPCRLNHIRSSSMHLQVSSPAVSSRCTEKPKSQLLTAGAFDAKGHPCTDAAEVLSNIDKKAGGGIMPLGGAEELTGSHKGYGYAMLCEIFCSILSMGLTSNHSIQNGKGGTCHGFIAIDPAAFGDAEAIKQHLSDFLTELRESPKADGKERIYTHGEKEILATADRMKNGLDVVMSDTG